MILELDPKLDCREIGRVQELCVARYFEDMELSRLGRLKFRIGSVSVNVLGRDLFLSCVSFGNDHKSLDLVAGSFIGLLC